MFNFLLVCKGMQFRGYKLLPRNKTRGNQHISEETTTTCIESLTTRFRLTWKKNWQSPRSLSLPKWEAAMSSTMQICLTANCPFGPSFWGERIINVTKLEPSRRIISLSCEAWHVRQIRICKNYDQQLVATSRSTNWLQRMHKTGNRLEGNRQ